jgi:hypothetical protein
MSEAERIADRAIEWLRDHYDDHRFFVERDLVWTVQLCLRELLRESNSELRVFNDFPMIPTPRRSLSADLALVSPDDEVQLALEFKFEPSHRRTDILGSKFPVVFWGTEGVAKDVERARLFVSRGRAVAARSYFIDEGGYFAHRPPHEGSAWVEWPGNRWVLVSRAP